MIKNINLAIKINSYLKQLAGWRRWVVLGSLGMMAALALPPLYLLPFLIPAFTGFFLIIEGSRGSGFSITSLKDGWWFGFGFFIAGLYWIGFSFFVDACFFYTKLPLMQHAKPTPGPTPIPSTRNSRFFFLLSSSLDQMTTYAMTAARWLQWNC